MTLLRPRQIQVLVVRQDAGGTTLPAVAAGGVIGTYRRGTGQVVDLPAGENDVLNALTRTGGLPGLDAMNEVVVQRGAYRPDAPAGAAGLAHPPDCGCNPGCADPPPYPSAPGTQFVRIPLRLRPGEPPPFQPEDVVLQTGDIVFIEARDTELFYVGGLTQPRQFVLPRDYDLRVVDAIARGRYTPSPEQRKRLAAALGLVPEQIAWGHHEQVEHMYGHGPQFGRSP